MNTLRAYLGSDTALVVWLRGETGKTDFADSEETLTCVLYPYGSSVAITPAITPVISGDVPGRCVITVTEEYAEANLPRGSYRYVVRLHGAQVQDGLLEVV